jgi:hypothetical protein
VAFIHSPKIITDGLVLALDAGNVKSYPGSGTTWNDLSGNNNNGTLTNGPTFDGANGGSVVFDGVNDYVSLASAVNTNESFTLVFWAVRTADANPTLFSGTAASGYLQIRMGASNVSLVKSFVVELGNFGASSAVSLNTIAQIVLTRTGTTYTVYVDGQQKGTLTIAQTYTTTNTTIGINSSNSEPFTGRVYQFLYYNRVLTPNEILQNFNATRSRFGV